MSIRFGCVWIFTKRAIQGNVSELPNSPHTKMAILKLEQVKGQAMTWIFKYFTAFFILFSVIHDPCIHKKLVFRRTFDPFYD